MRALVQRVKQARVEIAGETVGSIGVGLVILLGIRLGDTPAVAMWLADKCRGLRVFEDAAGKMNRSVDECGGELLVVSQFTLYGDCRRGNRPGFSDAAPPALAVPLYEQFVARLRQSRIKVETGRFGADMELYLQNHGPVTLLVERDEPLPLRLVKYDATHRLGS